MHWTIPKRFFSDLVIRHSGCTVHRIKPPLFVAMGCLKKKTQQQMLLKTFSLFLIWNIWSMQQYKPSQGIYRWVTDNFAYRIVVCLRGQGACLKHNFWMQIETRWVFAESLSFDIVGNFYLMYGSQSFKWIEGVFLKLLSLRWYHFAMMFLTVHS